MGILKLTCDFSLVLAHFILAHDTKVCPKPDPMHLSET